MTADRHETVSQAFARCARGWLYEDIPAGVQRVARRI